ncbi:MAG TPA: hypothetical protein ENG16_02055 [Archaeoglobus sp.]|nr:hypothetical protein [Archaeoglobus sp.]
MERWLREFRENVTQKVRTLLWRQWGALGVSSFVESESKWLIDPEALYVVTFTLGKLDKRLHEVVRIWNSQYSKYLSKPRYKRIWKFYNETRSALGFKESSTYLNDSEGIGYANKIRRAEEVLSSPQIKNPVLLSLRLRNVFGQNARAEVFLYFLYHDSGTSLSISREIFLDQKSVYSVLRGWLEAGILESAGGKKEGYLLSEQSRRDWMRALGISSLPRYLNWGKVMTVMAIIVEALETAPWKDDTYLLSSLFRDVSPMLNDFWRATDITPPEPSLYPGAAFASEFSKSFQNALQVLTGGK